MRGSRTFTESELKKLFSNLKRKQITDVMANILISHTYNRPVNMRTSGFHYPGGPDSLLEFDPSNRTVTLRPWQPEEDDIFEDGKPFVPHFDFYIWEKEARLQRREQPESIQLPNDEGLYLIRFEPDIEEGRYALSYIKNPDKFEIAGTQIEGVMVAWLYWNATTGEALHFGDSRHGSEWNPQIHRYLHDAFGARRKNGLTLTGTNFGGDGSSNEHAQFSVTGGTMLHDDFEMDIPGSSNSLPILYQYGTLPRYHTKTGYAIYQLSSRACYNSGGAVIPADEGFHVLYHIFATNEIGIANRKIISVMGRWHYETLAEAYAAAPGELDYALSWMPQQGRLHIATIVVQTSDAYTNDIHSRIVGIWGEGHPPVTIAENSKEILHITDRQELSIDLDAVVQEVDAEGTATEVVSTMIGNCKESFLIENTAATEIEQLSSWKVEAFNELVGDFNAIAVIRDKTANTVINLKNLLGFDFTEAANEVESDNEIVANAGATLQLSVDPSTNFLKAALSGMAANPKRIFFCFERCCLSVRPLFIQGAINGSSTFAGSLRGIGGLAGTIAGGSDMAGTLTQAGGDPDAFITEWTVPAGNLELPLGSGYNYNMIVDWGDGSPLSTITSHNDADRIHTYAAGTYIITITGICENIYFAFTSVKTYLNKIIQWGNVSFKSFFSAFDGCSNLVEIPNSPITGCSSNASCQGIFYGCSKLESIPFNLFQNLTDTTNFLFAFRSAGITSIPAGLFDYNISALNFTGTFYSGTKIKSIPPGLFDNNLAVTSFSQTFFNCSILETVPQELFANNMNCLNFSYTFQATYKLQQNRNIFFLDADINTRFYNKSVNFNNCFSRPIFNGAQGEAPHLWDCDFGTGTPTTNSCWGLNGNSLTSLSNYASIPTAWK